MTKFRWWMPVVLAAWCVAAYHNSFSGPFIFDDIRSIRENRTIRHLWPVWETFVPPHEGGITVEGRPLINFSLAVNYALSHRKVWGYHVTNLGIHILCALALLGVIRRTLLQPRLHERFGSAANGLALAVAVLWAVHPLQTESVTYIVQRAESIMGLFYLLTLYCFIRGMDSTHHRLWYSLCFGACLLGMASKEVMATAPIILLLYDRTFIAGSFREAWRRRWPLYVAVAGTWILLGYLVAYSGTWANAVNVAKVKGISRRDYLLAEPGVILEYLRLSVWPHGLSLDHAWPLGQPLTQVIWPIITIVLLLSATVWALVKNSVGGFIGAWFFLILAPTSSFIPTDSAIYEHRMYLPLAAPATVVVLGSYLLVVRFSRHDRVLVSSHACVIAGISMALCMATVGRNDQYRTAETIWADVAANNPGPRGPANFGLALLDDGQPAEAIPYLLHALQIDPNEALIHFDLGSALIATGGVQEGIVEYETALRLNPGLSAARAALAGVLVKQSDVHAAIEQYQAALAVSPNDARLHFNLGELLGRMGQRDGAIVQYMKAVQLDPEDASAHYNLANLLAEVGSNTEAVAQYSMAAKLAPRDPRSRINMGNALMRLARWDDAIVAYSDALRLYPTSFEAHNNLAIALANRGDLNNAAGHFREAERLKPDQPEVHSALSEVLEKLGQHEEAQRELAEARRLGVSGTSR